MIRCGQGLCGNGDLDCGRGSGGGECCGGSFVDTTRCWTR